MFEPLWVGIILPFTRHRPWCFKRAPVLVEMGRNLRRLLSESEEKSGNLLRKLWSLPERIAPVSELLASRMLLMSRPRKVPDEDGARRSGEQVAQRGSEAEKD